ncbi:MAG: putative zinc-binding protein [candidate division WOR-3 bacterium]|nr:putative zinc-binding protein [candidate division WOR-3 bacterium]
MAGCCASNEPTCACGSKDVLLLACSGGSNVGQIANDAAKALDGYGQGSMYCAIGVGAQLPGFVKGAGKKPCVAIDGCGTGCVLKILENIGVKPAAHVVVTELGIKKHGAFDYTNDDIAKVVGAVVDALAAGQT